MHLHDRAGTLASYNIKLPGKSDDCYRAIFSFKLIVATQLRICNLLADFLKFWGTKVA